MEKTQHFTLYLTTLTLIWVTACFSWVMVSTNTKPVKNHHYISLSVWFHATAGKDDSAVSVQTDKLLLPEETEGFEGDAEEGVSDLEDHFP